MLYIYIYIFILVPNLPLVECNTAGENTPQVLVEIPLLPMRGVPFPITRREVHVLAVFLEESKSIYIYIVL